MYYIACDHFEGDMTRGVQIVQEMIIIRLFYTALTVRIPNYICLCTLYGCIQLHMGILVRMCANSPRIKDNERFTCYFLHTRDMYLFVYDSEYTLRIILIVKDNNKG